MCKQLNKIGHVFWSEAPEFTCLSSTNGHFFIMFSFRSQSQQHCSEQRVLLIFFGASFTFFMPSYVKNCHYVTFLTFSIYFCQMLQFHGQFVLDKMRIRVRETYRHIQGVLLANLVRHVGHEFVVARH